MIETPTVTVTLRMTVPDRAAYETVKGRIDAFLGQNPSVVLISRVYVEEG